ncbi:hypothetical protein ACHAQH_008314 [Verticillium albo-atrum]
METSIPQRRDVSGNQFRDGTTINQGDFHIYPPHQPGRSAVRAIPYPRNTEVIHRSDVVNKLNTFLPPGKEHQAWHYWASVDQDYAYRRHDAGDCSVFWVHVDRASSAKTFFVAVREAVEIQPRWVFVVDNADDLSLFGVGQATGQTNSLNEYLPQGRMGTVIWTSRDGRVAKIVGPRRADEVT